VRPNSEHCIYRSVHEHVSILKPAPAPVCDMTPCSLVEVYRRIIETYCFSLQGGNKTLAGCLLGVLSPRKMEEARSSETSVNLYRTTRRHIPEGSTFRDSVCFLPGRNLRLWRETLDRCMLIASLSPVTRSHDPQLIAATAQCAMHYWLCDVSGRRSRPTESGLKLPATARSFPDTPQQTN
jgi:hypothetical protein